MTRRPIALALTLATTLLLAGCSGSSTGNGGVQRVTIHATNSFRYAPSTINAHTGRLRIELVDDGAYPHNISIPTLHATSATVSGDPGQGTSTLTVTLNHAGTYSFLCTFHSSAGMRGQIKVS